MVLLVVASLETGVDSVNGVPGGVSPELARLRLSTGTGGGDWARLRLVDNAS